MLISCLNISINIAQIRAVYMAPLNKKLLYWRYDTLLTISFPLIHTIIDGEKSIYWALLDTSWKYVREIMLPQLMRAWLKTVINFPFHMCVLCIHWTTMTSKALTKNIHSNHTDYTMLSKFTSPLFPIINSFRVFEK